MPVLNLGLPDAFVEQGTREELLALCGLDAQGIANRIEAFCPELAREELDVAV
jgi:1-deoxy-D-xylulose-5-phosphate synthase